MDTWIVSRNPIGVYHPPKQNTQDVSSNPVVENHKLNVLQAVVFFYKAHILAGHFRPDPDRYQDFAWLPRVKSANGQTGIIGWV